jgi:hypothetical protein
MPAIEPKLSNSDDALSELEQQFLALSNSFSRFDQITKSVEWFLLDGWSTYESVWFNCRAANLLASSRAQDINIVVTPKKLQSQISNLDFQSIEISEGAVTVSITQIAVPTISPLSDNVRKRAGALFLKVPVQLSFGDNVFGTYELSVELRPFWSQEQVRFTLSAAPRFIEASKYFDVVALAPAENDTRGRVRSAIAESLNKALSATPLGFLLPDPIKSIAPLASPFNVSVLNGLEIAVQGLGPRRTETWSNGPSSGFEISIFMDKAYFEKVLRAALLERSVILSSVSFDGRFILFDCYLTDRLTFSNGTNGYIDLRIDWRYKVAFQQPVENGWVVEAERIRWQYEITGECGGLLCDYFEGQVVDTAKRIISESQSIVHRIFDLRQVASASVVYKNHLGVIIDITELQNGK